MCLLGLVRLLVRGDDLDNLSAPYMLPLSKNKKQKKKQGKFDEFISPDEGLFERNM